MTTPGQFRFNSADRKQLRASVSTADDVDLATANLALDIDGSRYPCSWTGASNTSDGITTRTGKTLAWFAGPSVPSEKVNSAIVLDYGPHTPKLIVSDSNDHLIVALDLPDFYINR